MKDKQEPIDIEPPLDPAIEHVRRKIIKFMIATITITFLLVAIIFITIFYKFKDKNHLNNNIDSHITLKAGTKIIGQNLQGNLLLLQLVTDNKPSFIIYDYQKNKVIKHIIIDYPENLNKL